MIDGEDATVRHSITTHLSRDLREDFRVGVLCGLFVDGLLCQLEGLEYTVEELGLFARHVCFTQKKHKAFILIRHLKDFLYRQ